MQPRNLDEQFHAQTASKRLISVVIGGIAAFFAVAFISVGAFSFFLTAPIVLFALIYSWIRYRSLLSKSSIIASLAFLLFSAWGFIGLFNTGQIIPASTTPDTPKPIPTQVVQSVPTLLPKPTSTPRPKYTPTPDFREYGFSINQPMPLGMDIVFDDGTAISVVSMNENANRVVRSHDPFGTASPPRGHQFLIVNIKAINVGEQPIDTHRINSLSLIGKSRVSYEQSYDCWVLPNSFDTSRTIFPGGSLSGSLCFAVESSDVEDLIMYYEIEPLFGESEFIYWALK